jgi:DNA-binding response OmpR family regulator
MKILIIEDDDVQLSFLTRKLEAGGYEVVGTPSGTAACRSTERTARLNSFFSIIASFPA